MQKLSYFFPILKRQFQLNIQKNNDDIYKKQELIMGEM